MIVDDEKQAELTDNESEDSLSDADSDEVPIQFKRKRRWGLYPPEKTAACDQYPIGVSRGDRT